MQFLKFVSSALVAASLFAGSAALAADPENTMIIKLKDGEVVIALREDLAPKHVAQIRKLVRDGEYDNVAFHRVIEGFMAQTGDVQFGDLENGYNCQRVGMGGSSLPNIEAEFSNETFARGTVGMARSQDPNSANSQFFIMFAPGSFLDGSYTIVGNVESGMEFVVNIKRGQGPNGEVTDPDRMISVRIAADAK